MNWLDQFLMGAIAMGLTMASLFFFRYWRDTRDRFFGWFAVGFLVLAGNRIVLAVTHEPAEMSVGPYLVRFAAFVVFIFAIVDKNLRPPKKQP
jgi:hypothetical protein